MTSQLRFAGLEAELRHSALELAVSEIRRLLGENPALTGAEIAAALEAELSEGRAAGLAQQVFDESCQRCGRQVIISGNFVTHVSADGGLNRGCRAASFVSEEGWDESLPRSWYAKTPKK